MTLGLVEPSQTLEEMVAQIEQIRAELDHAGNGRKVCGSILAASQDPEFSPKSHLAAQLPSKQYTFTDLNILKPASASSNVAATAPFPLFTAEAIPLIRKTLFNPSYIQKTASIFGKKTLILRNTAAYSSFFRRLWSHPTILSYLSQAAGVELEPVMETMELGHANVQVEFSKYEGLDHEDKMNAIARDLTAEKFMKPGEARPEVQKCSSEKIAEEVNDALMPWHYDSYPWVCVAMVSDTTTMKGGETVIMKGNGVLEGISQPGMGSAMMLQGGLVKHLALPSTPDSGDRITVITSFRPKAVGIYDSSFMSNIRPYTDLFPLYRQWIEYRMNRIEPGVKRIQDKRRFYEVYDGEDVQKEKRELLMLREYAKRTLRQMVSPSTVGEAVKKYGIDKFFSVRDDYVSGELFKGHAKDCPRCNEPGAKITKAHLAVCEGAVGWDSGHPVWEDCFETKLAMREWGLEMEVRLQELQVKETINRWVSEKRPWGIADELAVQGLGEYLMEFLEFYGVEF